MIEDINRGMTKLDAGWVDRVVTMVHDRTLQMRSAIRRSLVVLDRDEPSLEFHRLRNLQSPTIPMVSSKYGLGPVHSRRSRMRTRRSSLEKQLQVAVEPIHLHSRNYSKLSENRRRSYFEMQLEVGFADRREVAPAAKTDVFLRVSLIQDVGHAGFAPADRADTASSAPDDLAVDDADSPRRTVPVDCAPYRTEAIGKSCSVPNSAPILVLQTLRSVERWAYH